MFRLAAGGVGGAANKNDRKFLGFAPRELVERGRGAESPRGKSVRSQSLRDWKWVRAKVSMSAQYFSKKACQYGKLF